MNIFVIDVQLNAAAVNRMEMLKEPGVCTAEQFCGNGSELGRSMELELLYWLC